MTAMPVVPAPIAPHRHAGGCCAGFITVDGIFSMTAPDGGAHSIYVDDERLVLGTGDWATVMTLTVAKPGMMSLGVSHGRYIDVVDGSIRIGTDATPFALQQVSGTKDGMRIRTEGGQYLSASGPGAPITLTARADASTIFSFARTDKYGKLWAADEGQPFDETHSTHLWIFNRAKDRILGQESLGNGPQMQKSYKEHHRDALRLHLADARFVQGVMTGIYDADNTGFFDAATSGFVFSAHFWNHELKRGGFWDPDPKINAFEYGTRYFRESLQDEIPESAGRKLGLAIHYLQDLTQPMHCGLYLNIPQGLAIALKIGAPPPWIAGRALFSADGNYRHENYEQWALRNQHKWTANADDLNGSALDLAVFADAGNETWTGYWSVAGERGLAEFKTWLPDDMSPIGDKVPFKLDAIADFAARWEPGAGKMIKLAQRLVMNLLLTWGALSKLANKAPRGAARWKTLAACPQLPGTMEGYIQGAQLWAVDDKGLLRSMHQASSAAGTWTDWSDEWNVASPRNIVELAAAGQGDGRIALWALTPDGVLHCNYQIHAGARGLEGMPGRDPKAPQNWHGWDPKWRGAPTLSHICACAQGGGRGAQLWGVDDKGLLRSTYQESRGGDWSNWSGEWNRASPRNIIALAAAGQGGRVALWALTPDHVLHCNYQDSAGGNWHGWEGSWKHAPTLVRICACEHGGESGAQLWGVDDNGLLRSTYQGSRGGDWEKWSDEWNGASPRDIVALAAAQENDRGGVALWAVTPDGAIRRNVLPSSRGPWTGWL